MIDFKLNKADSSLINKLVDRLFQLNKEYNLGHDLDKVDILMDVTATHLNGCPLLLEDWLNSDDFNFMHDMVGIINHLDRDTGKLSNHFLPRFAVK